MRILILGATGRTGRLLIEEAIKDGFDVTVLVRDKNKLPALTASITIYEGTPEDKDLLLKVMKGCEAVLSTLNISRTSDFPWAKLRTPENFLSESMKNIIWAAGTSNIKRLIITTAWGTGKTKKNIPWWFRWLINHSKIGVTYRDHELQEELLKDSDLEEWTVVRPVGLTNSKKKKKVQVSINNRPRPTLKISRQNVAKFMIKTLKNGTYFNQSLVISEKD